MSDEKITPDDIENSIRREAEKVKEEAKSWAPRPSWSAENVNKALEAVEDESRRIGSYFRAAVGVAAMSVAAAFAMKALQNFGEYRYTVAKTKFTKAEIRQIDASRRYSEALMEQWQHNQKGACGGGS